MQTLDLLADRQGLYHDVAICGEYYLPVHHCLLVKKGDDGSSEPPADITIDPRYKSITKLYTHPQAWGQCETFISRYFNGIEKQDVSSTSKAAEIVAQEATNSGAAIASKFAAEHHNLSILARNIEDDSENTTRFLLFRNKKAGSTAICGQESTQPGRDTGDEEEAGKKPKRKTLISFMIDHNSPGALADALVIFKKHGMNLTTINSRPGGIKPWQYIFFVECQGHSAAQDDDDGDETVTKLMEDLKSVTESQRHLGSWNDTLGARQ